jgi:hypothetical protein
VPAVHEDCPPKNTMEPTAAAFMLLLLLIVAVAFAPVVLWVHYMRVR